MAEKVPRLASGLAAVISRVPLIPSTVIARFAGVLCLLFSINAPVFAGDFDHEHKVWDQLLRQYVQDHGAFSGVNYRLWKQQPQALEQYLAGLSKVNKKQFQAWTPPQRLAFLINAYNAFTVKLILQHYPVKSIKDIGSFFRSAWKIRFFRLFQADTHLDEIEHRLIRGAEDFSEPRIHFALVCASIGCPKLQPQAYTAARLETMLESGAKAFLGDRSRNRYSAQEDRLLISSLFKWYGKDFDKTHGSVARFIAPYLSDGAPLQQRIAEGQVPIDYLAYDWALNEAKGDTR
ncbi:MAG: DUF547 domain-containing protein [Gammaproteobacteria bacterium]|nr:DUF547 domain-containing protein [Gammaproteobacteria bacterium]MDH5799664.1 DUF547 domain-containing protein [Gammaproteobacteria bacterium]